MPKSIASLEAELDAMRDLVSTVMRNSSDQGFVVEFLRTSFTLESYEQVADTLIEQLATKELAAGVLISTDQGRRLTKLDHGHAPRPSLDFIHQHRSDGRIYEEGQLCLINFDHISAVIINMPSNDELRGSLRDLLATLLEAAEAKVCALNHQAHVARLRRAKDEFYMIMSHELKTPLNSVIGFSTFLQRRLKEKISKREQTALNNIHSSGNQLLSLVDGILDLARHESGDIVLNPAATDLHELLNRLSIEFKDEIHTSQLCFEARIDSVRGLTITLDPGKLQSALEQLLDNAKSFTREGSVRLQAENREDPALGSCIAIHISDTGIGIAPESLERIFEPFTQVDSGIARESKGTGIGLTLAQKLTELHGGRIDVSSILGEGSTFSLLLPH